ncbi:MAG TPA: DUF1203 domain-containing protein [Allosphingosinicella sp.]|jgi:hypothetical protein
MTWLFSGLPPERFQHFFALCDRELKERHVKRLPAGRGVPCRVSLQDAAPGEPVLLLPFEHHPANSPYRSSGPIFIRQAARAARVATDVPESFRGRLYSARAYDADGNMVEAEVGEGRELEALLERVFAQASAEYVHLHHARRGCYACRVDRA